MQLRPYQQCMIDRAREALGANNRRVMLQLPTGGGKTVIFCSITQRAVARGRRVLILVHRRELVVQTRSKLTQFGIRSDAITPAGNITGQPVAVAMVQTLAKRPQLQVGWDLVIVDEAHHALASTWADVLDRMTCPVLGFSATPCRLDGRPLGHQFDHLITGPTVSELITGRALSDFRYLALPPVFDPKGVRKVGGDYSKAATAEQIDRRCADVVTTWRKHASDRRTIVFVPSVKVAEHLVDEFGGVAALVEAKMPRQERASVLDRFASGALQVLISVDLVSEGFDVPACDCVLLARPTDSLVVFLQQVGRGLRPSDRPALILDCVGNVHRHGLPDAERAWSLSATVRDDQARAVEPISTCDQCLSVWNRQTQGRACPFCGWEPPKAKRGDLRVTKEELVEIERDHAVRVQAWAADRGGVPPEWLEPEDYKRVEADMPYQARKAARAAEEAACSSLKDWQRLGKLRGYKPGWAWHQWSSSLVREVARLKGYKPG